MNAANKISSVVKQGLNFPAEFLLCLIAFALPFGGEKVVIPIVLFTLFIIYTVVRQKGQVKLLAPKTIFLLCLLYLLSAVGMLYTHNVNEGWFKLEEKFSMLLFPIVFSLAFQQWTIALKKIFLAFVAGCLVAGFICLFHSCYLYLQTADTANFYYENFSYFLHPSYFAMYVMWCLIILFLWDNKEIKLPVLLRYLLIAAFVSFIIFLSSRTGVLSLLIIACALLPFSVFRKGNQSKNMIYLVLLAVVIIGGSFFFNKTISARFTVLVDSFNNNPVNPATVESVDVRKLLWKSSAELISQHFLTGVGTGDVNDALNKVYQERGMTGALKKQYNSHNQFLQIFVALGIGGFIALLLVIFMGVPIAIKSRDMLPIFFTVLIVLNFFTESVLETEAGVIFFSFFNSLLVFNLERQNLIKPN